MASTRHPLRKRRVQGVLRRPINIKKRQRKQEVIMMFYGIIALT